MGTFGSSKTAETTQTTKIDNRQTDAKIAADGSKVVTAAGGVIKGGVSDQAGAIIAGKGARISIQQVDPKSYEFASRLAESVTGANGTSMANAGMGPGIVEKVAETVGAGGQTGWKKWAIIGGVLVVVGGVALAVLRRRK